jgi:Mg/Co/Ni transporter MgtE
MSLLFSSNSTLHEIVSLVESLPKKAQAKILRQAKLEQAKITGAKISEAQKKVIIKVTDNEISDMVHQFRKKKNSAW